MLCITVAKELSLKGVKSCWESLMGFTWHCKVGKSFWNEWILEVAILTAAKMIRNWR